MKLRNLTWLTVLALLWGPAFLFMKVAVQEVPPLTIAAVRVCLGAVLLCLILALQGVSLPKIGPIWKDFAIMGLSANAIPFAFLSWGQQYIDSAVAAILMGAMPLFTMLLAHIFTADDTLSPNKVAGMLVGFGGLVALFVPDFLEGFQATLWGGAAVIGAALSYSVAFVYARQRLRGLPPLVGPAAQLVMAAIYLLPLSFILERPDLLPMPAWSTLNSLLLLTGWSTVLAFVVYYRAMEHIGATTLSLVTYLNPLVATILGVVILQEQLGWNSYLGYVLIISGAMIVNSAYPQKVKDVLHWAVPNLTSPLRRLAWVKANTPSTNPGQSSKPWR